MNKNNRIKIPFREKIIVVIFGLFLTLIILEIGLRLGGFIILSLQERRNQLSIRQRGECRILCLGESTTQNQYPAFLEEILNRENIGIKFSVIDKGIIGTNTGFILSQLEANLDKCQPDLVVTMIGINDSGDYTPYEVDSTSKIRLLFKSFRTYKLARLLLVHIITKAKEMEFYKLQKNNLLTQEPEIESKAPYTEEDNLTQQETNLKKFLELNPQDDRAYSELGSLYLEQGKPVEAERVFKKALELNPQNDQAYMELSSFYIRQGKPVEAERLLKKALELNPQDDRIYRRLAAVYGETGNYILRKEYEEKAKQMSERFYNPVTVNNYRRFKQILDRRKVKWICVQYPVRSIKPLKKIFEGEQGIFFVDNEEIFKTAVLREGYSKYFVDVFSGDFGHCTEKGNKLLAGNIAKVLLKEVYK
ncbi:MAG: tetratricopeptide repeat protein [Candidatus Omnitrophica bacterium]|nr:tetratricopeptide repeat protein [Candidatus Omnitrophota bacterium]